MPSRTQPDADIDNETRRLLMRLHDEKDNPIPLCQNLFLVHTVARERLLERGIATTPGSITTCLMYMARDGKVGDDPLRQVIIETVKEIIG